MQKKHFLNFFIFCLSIFLCLIASGCSESNNKNSNNISGSAVKGIISQGIVKAYSIQDFNLLLAETRTNAFGQFTLNLDNQAHDIILLELSTDNDTSMVCDLTIGCLNHVTGALINFGDNVQLPNDFKLLGLAYKNINGTVKAFITPLSHIIVSTALKNQPSLNAESIKIATNWVKDAFKLSQSPIQTQPKDITELLTLPITSDEELKQSILGAAMYPETLSTDWARGNISIDSISLREILERAAELAGELSSLIAQNNPDQALALNRIQSDTEAQLVTLNTSDIVILSQPSSVTSTENLPFSLSAQANSDLELSYQWFKDGTLLPGANSAIYSKLSSNLNDTGIYHVVVSNSEHTLQSLSATVTINKATQALQITQQPTGLSITAGDTISLSVIAIGEGQVQYQWQKNGSLIPGATSNTYFIANSQTSDAGTYRVVVSDNVTQLNSNFVNVWVSEAIQAININQQPQSQIVPEGGSAVFSVSASGGGFISYQWRKNGLPINNAFSNTYTIPSVGQSDIASYDVVISNSRGNVTSIAASLSVISNEVPVIITHQPQSVVEGQAFTLSVSASGDHPISYQWFLNGNTIPDATSALYQKINSSPNDQGDYTVLVSNAGSSELSNSATISIEQAQLNALELTWDTPTQREDGSNLSFEEIDSYVIEYGYSSTNLQNRVNINNQLPNTYVIDDLLPGTIYLRIATVDSNNRQGAFSQIINITIP